MNSSDIIAIIAIGATVLTTIISALVIINTTRSTIQAKRSEIAFSERLKAFQKTFELISDVNSRLNLFQDIFHYEDFAEYLDYNKILNNKYETMPRKVRAETMRRLATIDTDFMATYNIQRVYIPPHIDREILNYYKDVLEPVRSITLDQLARNVVQMKSFQESYSAKILSEFHKFIGLNWILLV